MISSLSGSSGRKAAPAPSSGFAALLCLLCLLSSPIHAKVLFPCLGPDECPAGLTCNWGLCEDPINYSASQLFKVVVLDVPDLATHAGTDWFRSRVADTLARFLEHTGLFSVERLSGGYPVQTSTLFTALNRGAAYVIAGELTSFVDGKGTVRVRVIDAELGQSLAVLQSELTLEATAMDSALEKWSNMLVKHFSGRPGILGARLALVKKMGRGVKEVFTLTYGHNRLNQITFDRSLALLPSWTVDGRIAYTSYREGAPKLYIDSVKKPFAAFSGMNTGLEWSKDGSMAAVTLSKDGNPEVYLLEGTTGEERARLTYYRGIDTSPTFSPDGSQIAFVTDRDGTPQIYVMNSDGTGKERVTKSGTYNTNPDWHPFGAYLVYNGRYGGSFQTFRLDLSSGAVRQLTHGPGDCEAPDWSPDGRLIAFSWQRRSAREIYVMNPDGSNKRAITDSGPFYAPVWEILRQPE